MAKNKNIWILQTGEPLHIDQDDLRPMRGMNLADKLSEKGNNVTLISSLFNHQKKMHRSLKYVGKKTHIKENLALILLDSPGYKKNISIRRIYDHLIMSYNLLKFLSGEKKQSIKEESSPTNDETLLQRVVPSFFSFFFFFSFSPSFDL